VTIRLSETQRKIVQYGEGALLVVAGPGSGKTRVLTERIRRLLSDSEGRFRILALTFTNKAANEMKERLEEFPDINQRTFIGTLHSFCMEVLANRGKPVGIENLPHIFELYQDRKQVLLQAVMDDPHLKYELENSGDAKEQGKLLESWLKMIGTAKNDLLLPEMLDDDIDKKVYEVYDKGLRASKAVDYDDLLFLTYRLFTERPKIADFYRRQYRYVCIDEAQDLNEAQYQVIRALCGSEYRNVMMVGDPKQAIFVWNGAHPKYLDLFKQDFDAEMIRMNENFRSSQAVVKAAKVLSSEYEVEGQLLIAGDLKFIVGEDEKEEAVLVLDYLDKLMTEGHEGIEGSVKLERCALLGRNRFVFSAIEEELAGRQWPYYKQLSTQHESESDLLKDFELCLRLLSNPHDRLHLGLLLRRWRVNGEVTSLKDFNSRLELLSTLKRYAVDENHKAILEAVEAMEWTEQDFKFLKAMSKLEALAENSARKEERALIMEDIKVWQKHWDCFLHSESGSQHNLTSFLGQVALGATQQPHHDGLALLTIHSAKGLEFDVVVVMGMAEGIFPDYRAKDATTLLEEEKRSAFVAVTRSKRLLCFSYSQTRVMSWGETWRQQPSRYLEEIKPA